MEDKTIGCWSAEIIGSNIKWMCSECGYLTAEDDLEKCPRCKTKMGTNDEEEN